MNRHQAVSLFSANGDRASAPIELNRVIDQVVKDLFQSGPVGLDDQALWNRDGERDLDLFAARLGEGDGIGNYASAGRPVRVKE